ncbi:neurexin [Paragonimus westermani]|uniref:Neurexin n=1 Tax=Paragonimus westermani TaxID=34504 RepID=A0A5J4NZG1_9TREM|nr:neurexin [Paragonimus westermani]
MRNSRAAAFALRIRWSFSLIWLLCLSVTCATNQTWNFDLKDLKISYLRLRSAGGLPTDLLESDTTGRIPSTMVHQLGEPQLGVTYPRILSSGLIVSPSVESSEQQLVDVDPSGCPWMLSACPAGQFMVGFEIKPTETSDNTPEIHVFSILTRTNVDHPRQFVLQFVLTSESRLLVRWYSLNQTDLEHPSIVSTVVRLTFGEWNSVQATVKISTDELLVDIQRKSVELERNETGQVDAIGTAVSQPSTGVRRNGRSVEQLLRDIPMNMLKKVEAMDFTKDAYVRYDFRNRLKKNAAMETLTIDFELPTGAENGLIWFSENEAMKSYVYLKDSRLHYTYVVIDKTGKAQLTLTEEIFLNTPLAPNTPHVLSLIRNRDNLTLTLNERSHASKAIDGRVPLVPSDGHVYLGGSAHPSFDTGGKVSESFRGRITKVEAVREGDKKVDLLQVATDPHWQDSVHTSGQVKYEYKEPKVNLVISPTAPRPFRQAWNKGSAPQALALTRDPIPITFMGTQSSVVRFDTWDFTVYRSFEIEFMTYEPNGILFFVGPDRDHTDFVCVELFDGNVYFVYAVGDHYRHIQLNPLNVKVNTGMSNRVYVSRNEQHRFLVKFNDRIVDVDQGTVAHQTEFATYTYIGSVDQSSRLPWHVWSRENFAGCIPSIRINDDKFLDPSSRMSQHTDVSRGIQFGVCRVPDRRCTREICGGGRCAERSYPFFEPLNFACECGGSDKTFRQGVTDIRRSEGCFRDAPILEMDGEMVLLIDFERQLNTLTTHTDDISLQFKTTQSSTPLFYAVSPADKSYFRVDLVGGRIRIQTNINHPDDRLRAEEFFLASSHLNDNRWHTLQIKRRAEHLAMSVDGSHDDTGKIPLQSHLKTFKLVAQQIYLGSAGPPDYARPPPPTSETKFLPPPPRFIGEFRNFYWNEYDFIGTGELPSKYTTDMLSPRAILPVFPQWPRQPTYSITCTPKLYYGRLDKVIDIQEGGDMWLVEFKTEYEGVLFSAHEPGGMTNVQISLVLLRGRLHVVYSIYGRSGVHQLTSGPSANALDDGNWHRVVIGLDRRKKQLIAFLDSYPLEASVYWNGRYPINDLKAGHVTHTGEVTIVLTPEFPILPPKPQPVCLPDYCLNGGACYAEDYQLNCDCSNTGWNGVRCERQSRGYLPNKPGNGAYVIYTIKPPKRTNTDEMRVAIQTWSKDGPIARVVLADSGFYDVGLIDGKLLVSFNGQQYIPICSPTQTFNDGRMHVVTVKRNSRRFNITVDGYRTQHEPSGFVGVDGSLVTREIVLGADRQLKNTFDGVIGGFYWNGQYLINERGSLTPDATVMIAPGRQPASNMEEVVVVLMPHLLHPSDELRPGPPKPLPDGLPEGSVGGGVVMPGLGTGNVNLGAPIYASDKGYGGGAAGMNAGTGLMLKQAGGLLGMGGLVDALMAGLLLALLLLLSALIWACWRCKPGCCPFCYGKSRGGGSAWNRLVNACCTAPSGTGKETSRLLENGNKDIPSGEVFKIMEGQELGCTDLHLACDDTVLVTQVVDDLGGGMDTLTDQNAMRIKRMQLWDFVSGRQLEMPMEVMCTSLCLTRKSEHVIVARSSHSGPSILVWNLPANQRDHEIFYDPINPVLRDNVTYLNISHDDRLVVAGCKNEEQACYMVFDLAAHYPVPAQPRMVVFDAEVNATEILGPDTAVTGTRKGELLVWNLHTGEVVRQIQISATLEGGNMTALAPHSGTVHCIQLSEDGRYLVTGAQDQLVRVWLMPEERLLHTLEGHADDVLSVAISKDSEIVVSGSWDGSIRVWRLRDGNQICWFSSNIEILQVKISNDKRSLVALGERNEHRKLITLRVLRNRVRTTTSLRPAGSRVNSSMSPPTPGMSPGSPVMMA